MSKSKIESLLASFPKLTNTSTQHTTVETDAVRFVYQPLEEMYMVLVTTKGSNILEDIDTLHLFAQVVTSICRNSLSEREVLRNAFELLSAFDEIICLGYRENLKLPQVQSILEMESHEEKIQDIIARNKEHEASEERKRRARQLEMQRREMAKFGPRQPAFSGLGSSQYQSIRTSSPDVSITSHYENEKAGMSAKKYIPRRNCLTVERPFQ
jgi:coatomer subunit delta